MSSARPLKNVSDEEFSKLYATIGPSRISEIYNVSISNVKRRRKRTERRLDRALVPPQCHNLPVKSDAPGRIHLDIKDGVIIVGSDAHYWPKNEKGEKNPPSIAHRAFVDFCKKLKPEIVVMNGDAFDGATVSRHARINWEYVPTVQEELAECQTRLSEIAAAAKNANLIWTLGNHDARFEMRLANIAPEYKGVKGVHLRDHFPKWRGAWSAFISETLVIKHRMKGGVHATHNNTVAGGLSICTGHLHSLKVTPYSDYRGTRYGIDCGTLAAINPRGAQFQAYLEDNPVNWRSGFVVFTFEKGEMLQPETVLVREDGRVDFRGKLTSYD